MADELTIPVIGIGAGPDVDGQVLVVHDLLGITKEFKPRFLRRYAELHDIMTEAVQHYVADVKSREFPSKEEAEAQKLLEDARLLQEIGCFGLVLEKIPASLAKQVAEELTIPVIGIGAGPDVDGQVLVVHDLLGITKEFKPRFLRRYAELHDIMTEAVQHYVADVKSREFPSKEEGY